MIRLIPFLLIFLFLSGCQPTTTTVLEAARVARVIDGDTLELTSGEVVRLLHINTPEKGEKCYQEAQERLAELVFNKTVFLERDMQSKDKRNRSLRYIYLSNSSKKSINQILVEEGLAIAYILLPNTKYKAEFFKAEETAIENKRGCLWQNASEFQGCIKVIELAKCPDDYVVLANICNDIELNGWILRDQGRSRYSLSGIIRRNSTIKITREGWQSSHKCIWNDYSNTLYIFDNNNRFVLRFLY